jgi:hypothetical protein
MQLLRFMIHLDEATTERRRVKWLPNCKFREEKKLSPTLQYISRTRRLVAQVPGIWLSHRPKGAVEGLVRKMGEALVCVMGFGLAETGTNGDSGLSFEDMVAGSLISPHVRGSGGASLPGTWSSVIGRHRDCLSRLDRSSRGGPGVQSPHMLDAWVRIIGFMRCSWWRPIFGCAKLVLVRCRRPDTGLGAFAPSVRFRRQVIGISRT